MPTDVSAPLPDLTLKDESILTVDTGDPAAIITSIVVHFAQDAPESVLEQQPPLLAHLPVEGG